MNTQITRELVSGSERKYAEYRLAFDEVVNDGAEGSIPSTYDDERSFALDRGRRGGHQGLDFRAGDRLAQLESEVGEALLRIREELLAAARLRVDDEHRSLWIHLLYDTSLRGLGRGEREAELGSLTDFRVRPDRSSVPEDDALHMREAHADPWVVFIAMQPFEWFEYFADVG